MKQRVYRSPCQKRLLGGQFNLLHFPAIVLTAGKAQFGLHVWIEPFVALRKEACDSLDTAAKAVRHVHCAPDMATI